MQAIAATIAKNTLFNFIDTATDLIMSFVVGIALARSLGAQQYGVYAYLMWFLGFAALLVNMGLSEMVKRFIAEAVGRGSRVEAIGLVRQTIVLRVGAALAVSAAILISSSYWAGQTGSAGNQSYFWLLAVTILAHSLSYVFISIFRGFQKYEYAAAVTLVTAPVRLVIIIVLMLWGFGIWEVLLAHTATLFMASLIGLFLLLRLIPVKELWRSPPLDKAVRNRALKYALTMVALWGVNYLAYGEAVIFFIGFYLPVDQVGFYAVAVKFSLMSMTVVPMAFTLVLTPAIAEQFGRKDSVKIRAIYSTAMRYVMILALPLAAGGLALARPIIDILYGVEYAPAAMLLQVLILPFAIYSVGQAVIAVIYGIERPSFALKISILLALIRVGLTLWLIPSYGLVGAAIASLVPLCLALPPYAIFVSKRIGTGWPWMDTARIVLASVIMALAVFLLQSQLSAVLAVALGVPVGIGIYLGAILRLRAVRQGDLAILKSVHAALPLPLRRRSAPLIGVIGRMVGGSKLAARDGVGEIDL